MGSVDLPGVEKFVWQTGWLTISLALGPMANALPSRYLLFMMTDMVPLPNDKFFVERRCHKTTVVCLRLLHTGPRLVSFFSLQLMVPMVPNKAKRLESPDPFLRHGG
jgi:hypothetical protein